MTELIFLGSILLILITCEIFLVIAIIKLRHIKKYIKAILSGLDKGGDL